MVDLCIMSPCFLGSSIITCVSELPLKGVDLLLGSDYAREDINDPAALSVLQEKPVAPADIVVLGG